jgi:2-oxoglutarate ferredoxin oxidoreductase subunit alpha
VGATPGPRRGGAGRGARAGFPTRFLQLRTLWPFPDEDVLLFCTGARHVFVVENNYAGQLERLIRTVVGPLETLHGVRKWDGRPFRPIEIIEPIRRVAGVLTEA